MIKKQATNRARGDKSKPANAIPNPSKKARLETMLSRPRGATQKQLERALGWQPHSVRAAISQLRKGGSDVLLDRSGRTPTYRIDAAA
ncbi:MAG: DUF3489 domain-containing protein [Silicimonas sp.]|nr:DUF3489 domain-containing protein [Silicimonas sp.]NND41624.1 DUF3489 domain-containing protein [Silicimonas sp.]NNL35339.1 DUF3489 domain-containing protein [Silicimonas sp.]